MIDQAADTPLTKFPIYEDNLDQVIGVLHVKDLMRVMRQQPEPVPSLRDLVRPALFVSETITISDLLRRFRQERQHLAILLDEYGGTAGLITLEDLLEELVGDVQDAFEPTKTAIQRLPDGSALIDGLTPIDEVNEVFGLALADPDYETIAGYVLGRLERLAEVGDEIEAGPVRLRVEAMDELRIARVRLIPQPPAAADQPVEEEA